MRAGGPGSSIKSVGSRQCIGHGKKLSPLAHNPRDFFEIKPLIESWGLGCRLSVHHPAIEFASIGALLVGEVGE